MNAWVDSMARIDSPERMNLDEMDELVDSAISVGWVDSRAL